MKAEDKKVIFTKKRVLFALIIVIIIILCLIGCQYFKAKDDEPIDYPVKVTDIIIDASTIELKIGESKKINTTIVPNNSTNKTIIYSSGDNSIATVDGFGEVTGIAVGETTINIKIDDVVKTIDVKVTEPTNNPEVTEKPVITLGNLQGTKGSNNWYISNVTMKVTSPTANIIKYCLTAKDPCTPNIVVKSGNSITLREGIWKVYITATNGVGETKTNTNFISIDTTAPKIVATKTLVNTTKGVSVNIICSDNISGVAKCVDGTSLTLVKTELKDDVEYQVTDKAGNTNKVKVTITGDLRRKYATCKTPGFSSWSKGGITCYGSLPTEQMKKSKTWAENNNETEYYSCGINMDQCGGGSDGHSCYKYTRTVNGCATWNDWSSTYCAREENKCKMLAEKFYS